MKKLIAVILFLFCSQLLAQIEKQGKINQSNIFKGKINFDSNLLEQTNILLKSLNFPNKESEEMLDKMFSDIGFLLEEFTWEYMIGSNLEEGLTGADTDNTITEIVLDNNEAITYKLSNNYPNPFNPSTRINYSIPKQSYVTLKVFDVLGREVATLVNKEQQQGYYDIEFDASHLTSGTYIYRIQAGEFVESRKMVLLK